MPTLYVLRHGETDWNAAGRLQGSTDVPLNDRGRAQAARNGDALAAHLADPGALLYASSPLRRAHETIRIARVRMGLPQDGAALDDRLMEARFGTWEGRLMSEIKVAEADHWARARDDRWSVTPPGPEGTAENFETVARRVKAFLDEAFFAQDRDMLVTVHGGVMRVIRVIVGETTPERVGTLDTPQDRVMTVSPHARIDWI